ncbi:hypothetical protein CAEBREN_03264 [Caenorhabditis brenneri]|uniref:Saposin B-type domain-containing protein n=1 Tax=Caenorhabditis brenneri TaxID=135651 RepID=G0NB62_CAEBE|nr:hypothetical protein CAEBREN_03264 [Caenorhabditis brenneri]
MWVKATLLLFSIAIISAVKSDFCLKVSAGTCELTEDEKGKELEKNHWSCTHCKNFLDNLREILFVPIPELNQVLMKIFCPSEEEKCQSSFKDIILIQGALGEFLKNHVCYFYLETPAITQNTSEQVCAKMDCVP